MIMTNISKYFMRISCCFPGWTCEMVSKVTDRYSLNESVSTVFTLVNIIESRDQCTQNLAKVNNPCADLSYMTTLSPTFTSVNTLFIRDSLSGDFIFYGSVLGYALSRYSANTGQVQTVFEDTSGMGFKARDLAYDSSTNIYWMLDYIDTTQDFLRSYDPRSKNFTVYDVLNDKCKHGSLTTDSNGTVWLGRICYGSQLRIFRYVAGVKKIVNTLSMQSMISAQIVFNAVGKLFAASFSGGTTKVTGAIIYEWVHENATTTENATFKERFSMSTCPLSVCFDTCEMAVDADSSIFLLVNSVGILKYDLDGSKLLTLNPRQPSSFSFGAGSVVDPTSLLLKSNFAVDSDYAWFSFDYNLYRYSLQGQSHELTDLKSFSGLIQWFICGEQQLATVPNSIEALLSMCPLNGVQWEAALTERNFFSSAEMGDNAVNGDAASVCDGSEAYSKICDTVGALPPYLCTRDVPATPVTYLGAAAGSAHLMYAVLVVLGGALLSICPGIEAKSRRSYLVNPKNWESDSKELLPASGCASEELYQELSMMKLKFAEQSAIIEQQSRVLQSQNAELLKLRRDIDMVLQGFALQRSTEKQRV